MAGTEVGVRAPAAGRHAGTRSRRTTREWVVRGLLAICAGFLGYVGVADSLANVVVKIAPETAYRMAPWNGLIIAETALADFTRNPDPDPGSATTDLAKQALRKEATAVAALDVLGLQAQLANDAPRAREIFSYSLELSRRELRPRLWAIEQAVQRGDIRGALRSYDIALRTSKAAPKTLFPVLGRAVDEPLVRAELIKLMRTGPVWGPLFLDYLADNDPDSRSTVLLLQESGDLRASFGDRNRSMVVNRLMEQGHVEDAWRFYQSGHDGARRDKSRDPHFEQNAELPSVFDWTPGTGAGMSVALLNGEGKGVLDFAASTGTSGSLVEQTLVLSPRAYRLSGRAAGVDQPPESLPFWTVRCRSGEELIRIDVPNSADNAKSFSGRFVVPQGCTVQALSLVARSSNEVGGLSGQIETVLVEPAS